MSRKFLYFVFIVSFSDMPIVAVLLLSYLSVLNLTQLQVFNPFLSEIQNNLQMANEVFIFLMTSSMVVFTEILDYYLKHDISFMV